MIIVRSKLFCSHFTAKYTRMQSNHWENICFLEASAIISLARLAEMSPHLALLFCGSKGGSKRLWKLPRLNRRWSAPEANGWKMLSVSAWWDGRVDVAVFVFCLGFFFVCVCGSFAVVKIHAASRRRCFYFPPQKYKRDKSRQENQHKPLSVCRCRIQHN